MRASPRQLAALVLFAFISQYSVAGKFECLIDCDLDGIALSVDWKPNGCYKPSPPLILYVSNARDYNEAVDTFNRWISEVDSYLVCVRNEARRDIEKVPEIILEGVKKAQRDMASEVSSQRTSLQLMRP